MPANPSTFPLQTSNFLWTTADLLHYPINAADFKTNTFPRFFFKHISDTYTEAYTTTLSKLSNTLPTRPLPGKIHLPSAKTVRSKMRP